MRALRAYIRVVDAFNRGVGRIVMYGVFVLMGILIWSVGAKAAGTPSLGTLELAQFAMVAYYFLGGPYSIQMGTNVRMDLFYGDWSTRQKAWVDSITVLFLIFFLAVLLYGGLGSTAYSLGDFSGEPLRFFGGLSGAFVSGGPEAAAAELGHMERSATAFRAYLWPIKSLMVLGTVLMLLQALSEFAKDILTIRGEAVPGAAPGEDAA